METVYSDPFIFDCANPYKVFSNETYQLIRNLIEKQRLHVGVFNHTHILEQLDQYKNGSESERFARNQILAWFAGNRFSTVKQNIQEINWLDAVCSSLWLQDSNVSNPTDSQLLTLFEHELNHNSYSWLFKSQNLPTVEFSPQLNWNTYFKEWAHFTTTIYIFDRYFFYNWFGSIRNLIGTFLDVNPKLKIELIGEYEPKLAHYPFKENPSFSYATECLKELNQEFGDRVIAYKINPQDAKDFHDRFLMTDFCLISSGSGFPPTPKKSKKRNKNTWPTLIGRYAFDNKYWETEYNRWDDIVREYCERIEM